MRRIAPRRVLHLLVVVVGLLALASLAGQVFRFYLGHDYVKGFVPAFFVDREANVPTWFATILLFSSSALLAVIAAHRHTAGDRFARHWTVLAVGFLLMSADEAAGLHELLIEPLRETFALGGVFYFSWVVVGIALVALVGIAFLPFVLALPARWRRLFIAAAALYVGGSIGLEMVGGVRAEVYGYADFTYTTITLAEETLEMLGVSLFIYALLTYIEKEWREIRLTVSDEETAPARRSPDRRTAVPPGT